MWVDTVYVVLLLLADEPAAARRRLEGHLRRLFDERSGLWGWRWDEDERRVTHPQHWGTGNGGVVAGIARAMRSGGAGDPWLASAGPAHARRVLDAVLEAAEHSGGFHDVVDDATTFQEGNVAQTLAYALLAGVADGWLPQGCRAAGERLVVRARLVVDRRGLIIGVCGAPRFDRPGTSPEARAMFLLATAAQQRLRAQQG